MRHFERLRLEKFSEILYSDTTPDQFSIYQVKITFQHLSFVRNAYLNCRKRQNPPGIEVLNFSFFRFILDYKFQNNLFKYKTSYIETLRETESDFIFVYFFLYTLYIHIYTHIYTYINIYTHIYTYIHISTHIYIY